MENKVCVKIIERFDQSLFSTFYEKIKFHPLFNDFKLNIEAHKVEFLNLMKDAINGGFLFAIIEDGNIVASSSFRKLIWDSNHFGYGCFMISDIFYNHTIPSDKLLQILQELYFEILKFAKAANAKFIYTKIESWDTIIAESLQANKFKYILTWVDGYCNSKKISIDINLEKTHSCGIIKKEELEFYSNLSEQHYFNGGRFFLDKEFDYKKVKEMYKNLVLSSFSNNDVMLSFRIKNKPVGLFICKKIIWSEIYCAKIAPLRFLIVQPELRSVGVGMSLFSNTLNFLSKQSDIITTGLEVHNLASLNIHSKMNFKFNNTHNVFHWWNKDLNI
jgi:hypothetical protein